jgi:hypothetical protein
MGAHGQDERVFATLEQVRDHGGTQWWLYASQCTECRQGWLIAQDERIHDNYYLKRLTAEELRRIVDCNDWPDHFLTYEQVLKLGVSSGHTCRFIDAESPALVWTVGDLKRERPTISVEEIASLLAIPVSNASQLLSRQ